MRATTEEVEGRVYEDYFFAFDGKPVVIFFDITEFMNWIEGLDLFGESEKKEEE